MTKNKQNSLLFSLQEIIQNNKVILLFLFPSLLTSCTFNEIFYEFYSFPYSKWDKKTAIQFEVPVKDISIFYDVFFELRHTNTYHFRNLWLVANYRILNKNSRQDTICIELANRFGEWYGSGIHLRSYVFPYQLNVQYPDTGTYIYSIHHGMQENPLRGISDFGLRVVKKQSNKK
ncbi:MAG: hypothetical protein Pg6B_02070 [Candidatus Azobacteroides pseudotrichonymphae]|jgi:gliding motility-associated lipoprotein GldH|uniref:Gliding motility lipoprotein GldH n=1 Tax=Azobacteroides pseudotrichonymphae genomovar. CFP2 TaxID=511995 RepID=B6YQP8_AZOPC|nr:gliding motility lipoprotein GldH [Candidatus Azobacteroides pseudotrichonymphae]BAG83520.1 conserved hypothetical protein [Candidatus Azobacteroides pseudotrichonymphae genomovar. CFP2]GMO32805.1 MAG: hypothetical protein Pg6B_02070 [Candidatus Azobacteroides pseudotrichonymphae]